MKSFLSWLRHHILLILIIFLVYAPFLDSRVIRTTGDEKVYIAQTIEMNSIGNWFVQVLNGQPDYYKGPLHYILIHIGLKIFGYSLWSALYMNLIFCLLGAVALAEIVRRTFPEKKTWPFWIGCFFSFNVGVFGHFFASQMEVELAGIFGLAYFFLWRGKSSRDEAIFWSLAGLAGWIKSPLHSVLLGVSAPLFWLATREFVQRMRSPKSWLFAGMGILICVAGYAPAYLLDQSHFVQYFVYRENLSKPANGGPWWQALLPIVTYYLIPWMTIALISYGELVVNVTNRFKFFKNLNAAEKRLLYFGLCTFLPTTLFFIVHPYRGENYSIPIVGAVGLLILIFLSHASDFMIRLRSWILGFSCLPFLIAPILLQIFSTRFQLSPELWPRWFMPLIWLFSLSSVGLQVWDHFFRKTDGLGVRATLGNASFLIVMGLVLSVFGEMEVFQLKNRIREDRRNGATYQIYYWNLNRLIWNEWGLMSLAVHEKILPLLSEEDLSQAIQRGDLILARDTDRGKEMEEFAKLKFPQLKPVFYPWNRWKTHASDGAGNSLIGKAWTEKDLTLLFDHALIMRFESKPREK